MALYPSLHRRICGSSIIANCHDDLGVRAWRRSSRLWMMPALTCLAFISSAWLTPPLGRLIADRQFRRHLSEYIRVADELKSGEISCPDSCRTRLGVINVGHQPAHVRAILAARCNDGSAVVVAFLIDTHVPLLHEGYVFEGYEDGNSCIKDSMKPEHRWPYMRQVMDRW